MSDAVWIQVTNTTGTFGLALSISSNCTLLALMMCKMSPVKGAYKNILIFFCAFTMFYSFVELFLRPIIHIYDDTLFVMQRKWFEMSPMVSHLTTTMYCGCYAMSFVMFALQFLYRYVATCKPLYTDLFQGVRFLFWIFGAFCVALSWEAAAFFLFPQSPRTQKMFLHIVKNSYGLDPNFVDYVPYRYFENDEGVRRIIMINIVGIIQHVIIMAISFGTLFYCAFKNYSTISQHKGMSTKTKELQMQLFRALVVQVWILSRYAVKITTIPTILMYIPLLFLYACPLFNFQLGPLANYQTIMGQLYPGVDPLAVLFLITAYRKTLCSK
ncbi:hypothetical protein CRE_16425 [Caenorhabditis remanei]|uniref:Serpentine receptor class r-10 n=1 Tax=Caenorhabditis remanei TaxID=31234 RepID=E3NF74_CAERE|nr:hypothetical protein CRE_16425 [Caenorhabditis remanei]